MAYRWPANALLMGMSHDRKVIFRSRDRMCDLHDSLCRNLSDPIADEYFLAVSIEHPGLKAANDGEFVEEYWTDDAMREVEAGIHEDFSHDDYVVVVERVSGEGWPKTCTAVWNIAPLDSIDD